MKLFLDSADPLAVKRFTGLPCIAGITTNPTILVRELKPRLESLNYLVAHTSCLLFVQVVGTSVETYVQDFEVISEFFREHNREWVVKVPLNEIGLQVIHYIKKHYPDTQILGTAIYTYEQCILGIAAGVNYLAPYVNRIQTLGDDPYELIRSVRAYLDSNDLSCTIMAASFKHKDQVTQALKYGAHTCTIGDSILDTLLYNESVENAINQFNIDAHMY